MNLNAQFEESISELEFRAIVPLLYPIETHIADLNGHSYRFYIISPSFL